MEKVAVISAILEAPTLNQHEFNRIVSDFKGIVRGRLGVPFEHENVGIISLTVLADEDEIHALTNRLGALSDVTVKTVLSKKAFHTH